MIKTKTILEPISKTIKSVTLKVINNQLIDTIIIIIYYFM